jgi:hypothetical protein
MQREDGCPQVPNGGVDVLHGPADALLDVRVDQPVHPLELQAGREQPLDDEVVQIAGDPVPVLEHRDHRLVPLRLRAVQSERHLTREHPDQIRAHGDLEDGATLGGHQ